MGGMSPASFQAVNNSAGDASSCTATPQLHLGARTFVGLARAEVEVQVLLVVVVVQRAEAEHEARLAGTTGSRHERRALAPSNLDIALQFANL